MITLRSIIDMTKDMDEEELDMPLYLSENISEGLIKGIFNIDPDHDEYGSIMEEIDNALCINPEYSTMIIGSTFVDKKVKEINKLSNINSVIEYVTDYNENKMDKEELTKLLLDYVK